MKYLKGFGRPLRCSNCIHKDSVNGPKKSYEPSETSRFVNLLDKSYMNNEVSEAKSTEKHFESQTNRTLEKVFKAKSATITSSAVAKSTSEHVPLKKSMSR